MMRRGELASRLCNPCVLFELEVPHREMTYQVRSDCYGAIRAASHAMDLMSLRLIPRSDRSLSLRHSSSRAVLKKMSHARILERTNEVNNVRVLL
jgi:hypothetical protein